MSATIAPTGDDGRNTASPIANPIAALREGAGFVSRECQLAYRAGIEDALAAQAGRPMARLLDALEATGIKGATMIFFSEHAAVEMLRAEGGTESPESQKPSSPLQVVLRRLAPNPPEWDPDRSICGVRVICYCDPCKTRAKELQQPVEPPQVEVPPGALYVAPGLPIAPPPAPAGGDDHDHDELSF